MVSVPSCDHLRECAGKSLEAGGQDGVWYTYPGERCREFEQAGQWLEDERGQTADTLCWLQEQTSPGSWLVGGEGEDLDQRSSTFFGTRDWFHEKQFSQGWRGWGGKGTRRWSSGSNS